MTAPVQTQAAPSRDKAPVILRPFKVGVQPTDDEAFDRTVTLTAGTQSLDQYDVPSTAFLNSVLLLVTATAAGNAAAVAFQQNGPFSVIDTLTFTDTGSSEIVGPINGWDLYIINKYGGYNFSDDAKSSPIFSATTGAVGAGGSFQFLLRIPLELVPRDALGSLPNKSASTPFRVKTIIAPSSAVYSVAPTNAPSIRVRMTPLSYWQPTSTDGSGNAVANQPPGVQTTQYWNKTDYTVNSGAMSPQLTNSTGFPVRNLIFVLVDNAGSRAVGETDFPDPFRLQLQSNTIVNRIKAVWQHMIAQDYGYVAAVGDNAGAKDNGVYVLPFCKDFGQKPGWETRRSYLRTTDGMRLEAKGTVGGAGTHKLTVYTNYVGVGAGATLAQITT